MIAKTIGILWITRSDSFLIPIFFIEIKKIMLIYLPFMIKFDKFTDKQNVPNEI